MFVLHDQSKGCHFSMLDFLKNQLHFFADIHKMCDLRLTLACLMMTAVMVK